jgi:hypothetical protein
MTFYLIPQILPSDSIRDTMDGAHEAIPHGERAFTSISP